MRANACLFVKIELRQIVKQCAIKQDEVDMARTILVTSGKGGVGKTTVCAGLGAALARMGQSVCLIDFDFGLNNLDLMLNIEDRVIYDANAVMAGRCKLKQALVADKTQNNLYFLATGRMTAAQIEGIGEILEKLSGVFDFCIIDCAAGAGESFKAGLSACSEVLIVTNPSISSLRDAVKLRGLIAGEKAELIGCVVNRIRGDLVAAGKMINENQIEEQTGIKVRGVIPESDDILVYSNTCAISECGVAFSYFEKLASAILKNRNFRIDYVSKYRGVFGAIKSVLKRNA